jgi:hypothetical protein
MPELRDRIHRIIAALTRPDTLTAFIGKLIRRGGPRGSDHAGAARTPLVRIEPRSLPPRRSYLPGQSASKN